MTQKYTRHNMFENMKTVILLALLTVLLMVIGGVLGGNAGILIAFGFAVLLNFFTYWYSDKSVLKLYKAKEIKPTDQPKLHQMVEALAQQMNLPKPSIYWVDSESPNAFATGRNPEHAVIAVTSGIVTLLDQEELRAVLAHELGHVKNRDALISTMAAVVAGAIGYLAYMAQWAAIFGGLSGRSRESTNIIGLLVMIIIAPLIAVIIRLAISRSREFLADATGAQALYSGEPLARALEKIEQGINHRPLNKATPGTAHLFISNPFRGQQLMSMFSTHPKTVERAKKLREMKF
jgi:heat shock protein HtpX